MSVIGGLKDFFAFGRRSFERYREERRWRRAGDYDKCFWARVQGFRARPDAGPDNPRFVGDLRWAGGLPAFLASEPEQIGRWISAGRRAYKDDPLTQLIAGEILGSVTLIGRHGTLEAERLGLVAEAYEGMVKVEQAVQYYQLALEKAVAIGSQSQETFFRTQLVRLGDRRLSSS